MNLWHPPPGEVEPFAWWHPLLLVSRRVREARMPWPVHLDEFQLCGRVDRRDREAIWVYRHHRSQGVLLVDATGGTYRYLATPKGRSAGRFVESGLREAVSTAGLPDTVEPVFYARDRAPVRRHPSIEADVDVDDDDDDDDDDVDPEPREVRCRHLRLVPTGTGG